MQDEFLSQTELGKLYGVSSHTVGQWLKDAGLRDQKGKPCGDGWDYVSTRTSTQAATFFYVWNRKKTTALLSSRGHNINVALSEVAIHEQSKKGENK
jgi:hypothetical protein